MDSKIRGYLSLGRDVIMANGYHITRLNRLLSPDYFDESDLKEKIYSRFSIGDRLTNVETKTILADIYSEIGLSKKAKASDITDWFEIIKTTVKGSHGISITKKK